MKPSLFTRRRPHRKSAGVALVTAIFMLVVLAGLAVAIVSITTSQQSGAVMDVQGQRAYQAAKAGTEWALYIGLRTGFTPPASPTPGVTLGCPGTAYSFKMPANTTLSAFTVTVTCTTPSVGVAGGGPTDPTEGHFTIRSTACNQPGPSGCPNPSPGREYVQRIISAQL